MLQKFGIRISKMVSRNFQFHRRDPTLNLKSDLGFYGLKLSLKLEQDLLDNIYFLFDKNNWKNLPNKPNHQFLSIEPNGMNTVAIGQKVAIRLAWQIIQFPLGMDFL